jgi:hypothetical protein
MQSKDVDVFKLVCEAFYQYPAIHRLRFMLRRTSANRLIPLLLLLRPLHFRTLGSYARRAPHFPLLPAALPPIIHVATITITPGTLHPARCRSQLTHVALFFFLSFKSALAQLGLLTLSQMGEI